MSKQIVKKNSSFIFYYFFYVCLFFVNFFPSSLYTCTSPCISADTFFVLFCGRWCLQQTCFLYFIWSWFFECFDDGLDWGSRDKFERVVDWAVIEALNIFTAVPTTLPRVVAFVFFKYNQKVKRLDFEIAQIGPFFGKSI